MRRKSTKIGARALVLSALLSSVILAQDGRWQPYMELESRGSAQRWLGRADVVAPLWQDGRHLIFADVRGVFSDRGEDEGNFGVAFRTMLDTDRIFGAYAFYDLRQSRIDNEYNQATLGAELLDVNWGLRGNVYLPELETQSAAAANAVHLQGNNIFLRQGLEAAYWGVDLEAEGRLWSGDVDHRGKMLAEWWAAAGVFHFDNPANGFESLTGPRVRTELRLLDLPVLGRDSRLVLGGQYEYDELRGSVGSGSVNVRIPLGPKRGRTPRLTGLRRRMQAPIVRDTDIVTNRGTFGAPEPVKNTRTGAAITSAVVLTADDDLSAEIAAAGADSVVILDGSRGDFVDVDPSILSNGQVVIGGGSLLPVTGCNSGARVDFLAPGDFPFVTSAFSETGEFIPTFWMADNSTIQGIGVYDSYLAIGTLDARNILVTGNWLFGNAYGFGGGTIDGDVRFNYVTDNVLDGIQIGALNGGAIESNYVARNGRDGIFVDEVDGGSITGNIAELNGESGIFAFTLYGGTISENISNDNGDDGIHISSMPGGLVSDNSVARNGDDGYDVGSMYGGLIAGNSAVSNGSDGFEFDSLEGGGGSVTDNVASGNARSGFEIDDVFSGEVSGNLAIGNGADGFDIFEITAGGRVEGNTAVANTNNGFRVIDINGGVLAGNSAESSGYSGFWIDSISDNAVVSGNDAARNLLGILIFDLDGGSVTGNIAEFNQAYGVTVVDMTDGSLSGNRANDNGQYGFNINGVSGGIVSGNSAARNGSSGYGIGLVSGGQIVGNSAEFNEGSGFGINIEGGLVTENVAVGNAVFGFESNRIGAGELSGNVAEQNGSDGFRIRTVDGGLLANNRATGNGNDGFAVFNLTGGAVFQNRSEQNAADGFHSESVTGGLISANESTGNGDSGFEFMFLGGNSSEFSGNSATSQSGLGYQIDGLPAVGVGTNVGSGNAGGDSY